MTIAGLERDLPICPLNDKLSIAGFIMFSDVELTVACAEELLKKAPEFDYIVTAEAKGIPLAYEMSRQSGKKYLVARKKMKAYMVEPVEVKVQSITTAGEQTLFMDKPELDLMRGKRILIVDDVISTGESLKAIEKIVAAGDGNIVGKVTVLAEGDAAQRDDIIFLEPLPLFFND
jgi:adenine phosphoribosyltransferase